MLLCLATLTLAQMTDFATLPRSNPFTTADDRAAGEKTYMGQCAGCHGPRGEGGRGPDLTRPVFLHAESDYAFFKVMRNGIDGTEMPRIVSVTDKEVWQVIAYVRSLNGLTRETARGDANAGKATYYGKGGCANCHLNRAGDLAKGRALGPDLSDIGLRRSPSHLRESLVDPGKRLPDNFALISFTDAEGKSQRMIRLNEDTFSVRAQDLGGKVHSLLKANLKNYRREEATPMPSYKNLNENELDNLVAYLASLKGAAQ